MRVQASLASFLRSSVPPKPPTQPQDWVLTPATALDMVTFPKGWGAQKADSSLSPVFNLLCDLKIADL